MIRTLYSTIDSSSAEVFPEVARKLALGHYFHLGGVNIPTPAKGFLFRLFLPALFLFAHRRYNFQAHIPFQLCLIPPSWHSSENLRVPNATTMLHVRKACMVGRQYFREFKES